MPDIKEGSNKETVKTKRRMRLSCNSNIVGVANKRTHPIHLIRDEIDSDQVKSVGFSDYIVWAEKLHNLLIWWKVIRLGPTLCYQPKASKSWLIVKEEKLDEAKTLLEGTEVKVIFYPLEGNIWGIGTDELKVEYKERMFSI